MANENNESKFFHPSVTADIVAVKDMNVDTRNETVSLKVLLIRRDEKAKAFPGAWAIPGGFMDANDENIVEAAVRELQEETGLANPKLALVGTFTDKGRDPRGPVHSTAFVAAVPEDTEPIAGDDAAEAKWFNVTISNKDDTDFSFKIADCNGKGRMLIEAAVRAGRYGIDEYDIVKLHAADGEFTLAFDHDRILMTAFLKICENILFNTLIKEQDEGVQKED